MTGLVKFLLWVDVVDKIHRAGDTLLAPSSLLIEACRGSCSLEFCRIPKGLLLDCKARLVPVIDCKLQA